MCSFFITSMSVLYIAPFLHIKNPAFQDTENSGTTYHMVTTCFTLYYTYNSFELRLWCWEGLGAGGKGDDRGWDGWMAYLTRWTWVWVNSRSWWWTGRPGVLRFKGSQRVGHNWATELNWRIPWAPPVWLLKRGKLLFFIKVLSSSLHFCSCTISTFLKYVAAICYTSIQLSLNF